MEVGVSCKLKYPTWIESERFGSKSTGSLRFGRIAKQGHKVQVTFSAHFPLQTSSNRQRSVSFKVSCSSYKNFSASTLETGSIRAPYDEALMLKNKSLEVEPYLNGHSIYLIGSVGKILSQVLGYSFNDSDALIEQEVNGMSVAEIFKHHGQSFFRKKEEKGIVIWLDVPLEALARRIAAVGTHSRPLLHYEHGDPYTKALKRLSSLLKQRGKTYAKANARVSLEEIPGKLGYRDVSDLTPTEIAVEALEQIEGYVKEEGGMAIAGL